MSEPTPDEPHQIPLLVPQFLTERRLRERLAELGHAPQYSHELVSFDQDADGVFARIATPDGERTVRAAYLIGADGGSSFVHKALGIEFPGKTLGVRAIVADVLVDGVLSEVWHRWGQGTPTQVSLCTAPHAITGSSYPTRSPGRARSSPAAHLASTTTQPQPRSGLGGPVGAEESQVSCGVRAGACTAGGTPECGAATAYDPRCAWGAGADGLA